MKRSIAALAVILGYFTSAWAAGPAPLTSLRAIHALTNAQAAQGPTVAFEATVTYYRGIENTLFVQDGNAGIYVSAPTGAGLLPGDRVLVRGKAWNSFNPFVVSESISLLHHGASPKPVPARFDEMIRGETDCKLVSVRGIVHSADFMTQVGFTNLQLLADGGYFDATLDGSDGGALEGLLDAEVELTGVASETFDSKMQVTGILIHVQSTAGVRVLKRTAEDPWSMPLIPMDRVLGGYHVHDSTPRVRVHGAITYYEPGSAVILQDGAKSIWVSTQTRGRLNIGDSADATGFPDAHDGFLNLMHGEVRDSLIRAPVAPLPATWQMLTPNGNRTPGHHFDLVSIEGQVVTRVQENSQDEYVLSTGDKLFSAIYRHPNRPPAANTQIPIGSRVRVTGICVLEASNPFISQVPFNILLRTPDDIAVVAGPSLFNTRNLLLLIGLLLAVLFAVGCRGYFVERKVRRQTATLAYIEQRRRLILEKINSSRPLAGIIEEITELVSCKLKGAPCWCQISGGAQLGNCPPKINAFRVVQAEIPARSGPPLGAIFAGLDPLTKPCAVESEALAMATALAALAIETQRLYSDLLHRSEFDQLTNTHNRFSLDKHLDDLIAGARNAASIFGLVYVDLDRFKQINDLYGHHVGDRYLQEVALRMKKQLRSGDILARVGGDEFAALLPVVRSRVDVKEIALRLEQCFDEPVTVEDVTLHGSASVGIAVYPEDASNKDLLFRVADSAMYEAKNAKSSAAAKSASVPDGNTPEVEYELDDAGV
jgi:diguanylate cyclase (GGDEF)-like protein